MKKIIPLILLSLLVLTACETKVIQPTQVPTPTPSNSPTSVATPSPVSTPQKTTTPTTVKNFANSNCSYSFSYQNNAELISNEPIGFIDESPNVFVNLKGEGRLINVSCYASEDLKTYVQKIWQINLDDIKQSKVTKTVGELQEISFKDIPAYQFSLTGGYKYYEGGGESLKSPTTLLFTKYNDRIYEIAYLTGNKNSKEILDSFKFN